jgi:hypothetical protein
MAYCESFGRDGHSPVYRWDTDTTADRLRRESLTHRDVAPGVRPTLIKVLER